MSTPASFDGLPPECIQAIAVRACEEPFLGPPTALATLLRVSRRTHAALCVQHNSTLHARVFAAKFDTVAPARRFADAGQPLAAGSWAAELRRRWICLRRIRHVSAVGRLGVVSEDEERADLWLIYLMFIESDGKNFDQLLHWARVSGYIRTVIRELLSPSGASRPGYPVESTSRALGLWLMWFLTEVHTVVAEAESDTAQIHNMLRPWALASHKFDTLCAPFTHWNLPAPQGPTLGEDPMALTPHYPADLDLRDRSEPVAHMGRRIHLAPPRASLAAIMAFMVRLERNGPIPAHPAPAIPTPAGNNQFPSTIANQHPGLTIYPRTRYPAWYGPGCTEFDGRINRKGSAAYDSEWRRVLQCGNPFVTPRFKTQPTFCPGDLAGDWEGRFVFLTFDAFRDMLAGFMPAVQGGHLAQQPHVWRIREHHCLRRRRRVPIGRDDESIGEALPVGNALDAFIPADADFIQHGGEPIGFGPNPGRRLEVRVPDDSSMEGFRSYHYTTIDGPTDLPPTHVPTTSVLSPVPPPLDHMPDWDNAVYGSGWPTGDDEWEEEVVDTIITGEGHSSWGAFHLRGRIRAWDGMIILVKDYVGQNNGRGRWLYKGYVVAGGNWVGRWRDTFTAEHLSGYEGVFSVTRRF